jgi:phosphoribosylanthranilate isomerase
MTRIKICGIKEKSHALVASRAGADFIGLVLAPSPRQLTATQAQEIASIVREYSKATEVVGVFVNMPAPAVNRVARDCELDWVQLSGDESWAYCQQINQPLIKAVRIMTGQSAEEVFNQLAEGAEALSGQRYVYLLDSHVEGRYGGTGTAFDWSLASKVTRRFPVIIAGGLTPENVAQVIKTVRPWGGDVSSGVEVDGVKSIAKIQTFIKIVRRADDSQE